MVKRIFPIIFILFIWIIFAKPFILDNKYPFPADLQTNSFSLWSSYPNLWGPVKNPAQPDVINQIMPWKKLTIESLFKGQVPLWNPYSFSGTPHLANYQSSPFSATNIFYFIFNFNLAWAIAVLIQPLLAGIFTYLFAKSLKRSEIGSSLSAVSFMFCGFITTWMSYTTLALAICFLPLALFAIEKYNITKKYRFLLLLTISFPLSFFSGHFQTSIYLSLFIFAYIIFKFIDTKDKKILFESSLFSVFGILISTVQILPSIELYLSSVRSSTFQKIEALPIKYLPTIIAPDFYGNPVTRNNFLGNYAEWNSFAGVISFLLALYSIINRNKYILFFSITGLISLILALDSPLLDLIVKLKIPVLSTSSASRILVIFSFSISILAGYGIDQLRIDLKSRKTKKILSWMFICSFIFGLIWIPVLLKIIDPIYYKVAIKNLILPSFMLMSLVFITILGLINKRLIMFSLAVILILTTFDLIRFSTKWQIFSNKDSIFRDTPITKKLQTLDNTYRIYGGMKADGSVYYHVPINEGYDPLYIARYGEFIGSIQNGDIYPPGRVGVDFSPSFKYFPKAFNFLGNKYVLIKKSDINTPWIFPFYKFPKNTFNSIYEDSAFILLENNQVFPRAYLVGDYELENEKQKIINKMLDKNFDLRRKAILENEVNLKKNNSSSGTATIKKYTNNKVVIETNSNQDSILILTDNFYPGWNLLINGNESNILRVDYTFRGAIVPKGKNEVIFYYFPASFKWGIVLSIFSILSISILILKNKKKF